MSVNSQIHPRYPLAIYEGTPPPAPEWFDKAVATAKTSSETIVASTRITFQQWGEQNKPGLLLVHGNSAHAHWYDFIAPYFTDSFNVAAVTFSGMGDSGWRNSYSVDLFTEEIMAVLKDVGMLDHPIKPIIAAHSMGGVIALFTAARHGEKLKGVITLDTPVFHPDVNIDKTRPKPRTENFVFSDQKTALSRFRLLPPQSCENHYILDYIARYGLKTVEENGRQGWSWKFDPALWATLGSVEEGLWDILPTISCNIAFLRGKKSNLVTDDVKKGMLSQINAPFISIENAGHHVFLDNPLSMIDELKKLFATWSD